MHTDRFGLPLTTSSDPAAAAYRSGVDCLLAAWPGAAAHFDRAIALDPDFALALAGRARVHQMYAEVAAAKDLIGRADRLSGGLSERERGHVGVLSAAINGQSARAIALAESHLDDHPTDAVVLSLLLGAFGLYAFSGRLDHDQARVAICEKVAAHYGRDWWFLGYIGWAHTEAGDPVKGRALTEQSFGLKRDNANAAHALAHAYFEQGDAAGAREFIEGWMPLYPRDGLLHGHISWHTALIALEHGDTSAALDLYERDIRPAVSKAAPLNLLTDGASLLWRVGVGQADTPTIARCDRLWHELVAFRDARFPSPGIGFADAHQGLFAAAPESRERCRNHLASVEARARATPGLADAVVTGLMRGFMAFAEGDYRAAIANLEPARLEADRIGGSHAQRELIEDTLIAAHLRFGTPDKARALIDQRLHRRPSARDQRWRTMAA